MDAQRFTVRLHSILVQCAAASLALVASTAGITMAHAGDVLSLVDLPIGETREIVLPGAETQWESTATCTTTRTGVGINRRAYFLETCVFDNSRGNTVYDETPASSHYYFLEGHLVQIAYEFDNVINLKKMRRCAEQDARKLNTNEQDPDNNGQSISVADDGRTVVFDSAVVPRIHAISGSATTSAK